MKFEALSLSNIQQYIRYLERALSEEPDMMLVEEVNENAIKERLCDPFFRNKKSILAIVNDEVVGRIEYHFYGCLQDGYRMAYVDWVYVLKSHRHHGVAQRLFQEFEKDCLKQHIDQYYLIRATNDNAERFYKNFTNAELSEQPVLRKTINGIKHE